MQTSYVRQSAKALPGLFGDSGNKNVISLSNLAFTANVWSYTVASDAETTTVVTLPDTNATQITVTTAAQGSAASTAAQHIIDLNTSELRFWLIATVSTAAITLTGLKAGWEFEVSGTNIGTPSEDTAAASSAVIPFGAGVVYARGGGCALPSSAGTKGIAEVKIDTAENSTAYAISVNGEAISYTSSGSATLAEISNAFVELINESFSLRTQVKAFTKDADELYIEALNIGDSVTLTESDSNISIVTTSATGVAADSVVGVAIRNHLVENTLHSDVTSTDEYAADSRVQVGILTDGPIWMTAKGAISAGSPVKVSVASGFVGQATVETSDSVSFIGTAYAETDADDGEVVRVRLK